MSFPKLIVGSSPDGIFDLSGLLAAEPIVAPAPPPDELDLIRRSGLFDATWYLENYPDLAKTGIDPLRHYHEQGWRQDRRPNPYFDPAWYREQNQDARHTDSNPLVHYIRWGERKRRQPIAHFDPAWYCATYGLANGEPCLGHFLEHRHRGKVSPIAEIEPPGTWKPIPISPQRASIRSSTA